MSCRATIRINQEKSSSKNIVSCTSTSSQQPSKKILTLSDQGQVYCHRQQFLVPIGDSRLKNVRKKETFTYSEQNFLNNHAKSNCSNELYVLKASGFSFRNDMAHFSWVEKKLKSRIFSECNGIINNDSMA
jgi:hypothetical protein